ncbi:hypothetical protein GA0070611_2117 [Micromonospora auratinigra]|uniref:Uncharacterized protein n=1 Tax=Micromonospora auratinigra TaxID=261654 RepID=A0A1A8ZG69_9ACTN|nr:hypothetical protein GA0070611_2117 [Micromonospora auratinigra]
MPDHRPHRPRAAPHRHRRPAGPFVARGHHRPATTTAEAHPARRAAPHERSCTCRPGECLMSGMARAPTARSREPQSGARGSPHPWRPHRIIVDAGAARTSTGPRGRAGGIPSAPHRRAATSPASTWRRAGVPAGTAPHLPGTDRPATTPHPIARAPPPHAPRPPRGGPAAATPYTGPGALARTPRPARGTTPPTRRTAAGSPGRSHPPRGHRRATVRPDHHRAEAVRAGPAGAPRRAGRMRARPAPHPSSLFRRGVSRTPPPPFLRFTVPLPNEPIAGRKLILQSMAGLIGKSGIRPKVGVTKILLRNDLDS